MLVLVWAIPTAANAQQSAVTKASLVFDGATVVDVEQGKLLPDQRVVITGNRIQTIGDVKGVPIPTGAQVVDAHGKYLIPGLWDMHTHSWFKTDLFYPLFLAHGVTGFRDAGSPVPLDTLLQLRREILAGTRVGPPRQLLSGRAITDPSGAEFQMFASFGKIPCSGDLLGQMCIPDAAAARAYVDSLKAVGADMIKPRDVGPAMYFVIAAEARRLGIPFGGHLPREGLSASEASDSGAGIIDHMYVVSGGLDTLCWGEAATVALCQPVAERFRRGNTWLVPTLVSGELGGAQAEWLVADLAERSNAFSTNDSSRANSAGRPPTDPSGNLATAHQVGLPIMAGTDASSVLADAVRTKLPGLSLHAELAIYVAEGLTPLEALQTATLNPAKFLHATDSLGTVGPGKLADLVLLDANPLADITNTTTIRAVVANGRYYDRATLDGVLAKARAMIAKITENP